jgi:cyclophilin family peptidyl-prolyl cis-trans isomerase
MHSAVRFLSCAAFAALIHSPIVAQETVLVVTRLAPASQLTRQNPVLALDLRDHFQQFAAPGPVARFSFRYPQPDGRRSLYIATATGPGGTLIPDPDPAGKPQYPFFTYKTADGVGYDNVFGLKPDRIAWAAAVNLDFQLYPEDAPITVANFLSYAMAGDFDGTIIHRNPSTGERFAGSNGYIQLPPSSKLPVLQGGLFRTYRADPADPTPQPWVLEFIGSRGTIPMEHKRTHVAGSLAMARAGALDSASSQFFINIADNSNLWKGDVDATKYAAFGELKDSSGLEHLMRLSETMVVDWSGLFSAGALTELPVFTPWWNERDSFVSFSGVTVAPGSSAGLSYSWSVIAPEPVPEGSTADPEPSNPASFDIAISGSDLTIRQLDTGFLRIQVSATDSRNVTRSFETALFSANPDVMGTFFPEVAPGHRYTSFWFGSFVDIDFPRIDHEHHGELTLLGDLLGAEINGGNPQQVEFVFHDAVLGWLYFTSGRYPWVYAVEHGQWLFFAKETPVGGGYRYFYDPREATKGWFVDTARFSGN